MSKLARWSDRPIQNPELRHAEPIDQNLHFYHPTHQARTSLRYELGVWHD